MVADGYITYETLAKHAPGITLVGCWAHARRGFADLYKVNKEPHAAMVVRQIAGLYRLEKRIRHRPAEKIRQWRQRYSRTHCRQTVEERLHELLPFPEYCFTSPE